MLENELGRPSAGLSGRGLLRLRVAPFARDTTRARWPLPGWMEQLLPIQSRRCRRRGEFL